MLSSNAVCRDSAASDSPMCRATRRGLQPVPPRVAVLAILVGSVLGTWLRPPLTSAADVTIDDVKRAWQARQDRTRSFQLEWTEATVYAAGTLAVDFWITDSAGRKVRRDDRRNRQKLPLKDTTLEIRWSLVVDGDRIAYSVDGPDWIPDLGRFVSRRSVGVFDEGLETRFSDGSPDEELLYPLCVVAAREGLSAADMPQLRPLLLMYRPLQGKVGAADLDGYSVSPCRVVVRGRAGRILQPPTGSHNKPIYHVDPARGFLVTRIIEPDRETGKPLICAHISYDDDPEHGPIPSAWKWIFLQRSEEERGRVHRQYAARVSRYQINGAVDASHFRVDLPTGTYVQDVRGPRRQLRYIVRPGGGRRLITKEERRAGASYAQLVATPSGKALGQGTSVLRASVWLFGLSGIAGLVVLTTVAVLRRRWLLTRP